RRLGLELVPGDAQAEEVRVEGNRGLGVRLGVRPVDGDVVAAERDAVAGLVAEALAAGDDGRRDDGSRVRGGPADDDGAERESEDEGAAKRPSEGPGSVLTGSVCGGHARRIGLRCTSGEDSSEG